MCERTAKQNKTKQKERIMNNERKEGKERST
jgi:hypothetical protein